MDTLDHLFMKKALEQAAIAMEDGEIPIGAVVTYQENIIARAHNQVERLQDVTAHAEVLAITAASNTLGSKYLDECTLYVTLEPCVMCAGALHWSRLSRIVIGTPDPKKGFSLFQPSILLDKTQIDTGLLAEESRNLLQSFFRSRR